MKILIATFALASILATSAVAKIDLAQLNRKYPCPEYNHAEQTCGVHKEPNMIPNNGRQNDQENVNKK
jgi:hypothetical protein